MLSISNTSKKTKKSDNNLPNDNYISYSSSKILKNISDIFSSKSEWEIKVENEINNLKEIYIDNIDINIEKKTIDVTINPNIDDSSFNFNPVKITINYLENYPKVIPKYNIQFNRLFTEEEKQKILDEIKQICQNCSEENVEMVDKIILYLKEEVNEFENKLKEKYNSKNKDNNSPELKKNNINKIDMNLKHIETNVFENPGKASLEENSLNNNLLSDRSEYEEEDDNLSNQKESESDEEFQLSIKSIDKYELNPKKKAKNHKNKKNKNNYNKENNNNNNYNNNNNKNNDYLSNGFFIKESRFHNDFEFKEVLGQGGGGVVFLVKNKFDENLYAIKRIKLFLPKDKRKQEEKLKIVQNESNVISRLQNAYIVRYYQTWIEDYTTEDENFYKDKLNGDIEEEYEIDTEEEKEISNNAIRKTSFEKPSATKIEDRENQNLSFTSDNVVFNNSKSKYNEKNDYYESGLDENDDELFLEKSEDNNDIWGESEKDEEKEEDSILFEKDSNNDNNDNNNYNIKIERSRNRHLSKKEKISQTKNFYIQMEYCRGKNLKDMIDSRSLNNEQNWKLIRQILEAVRYIHEKKLIHRDLKPGNIFLDENLNVKLGDFGLAKIVKSQNNYILNNYLNQNQLIKVNNNDYMTYAIGTKYYCSPEQEKSKSYNEKTDIFSIGIIIFEMFYFFNSLMERDKVLRNIKENQIYPEDFNKRCETKVINIVKECTNINPNKRPSAENLLNNIPIFLTEERVIDNFKQLIYDNEKYSEKFLEILIQKHLNNLYSNSRNIKENFFKETYSLLSKYIQNNYNNLFTLQFIRNKINEIFVQNNSFFIRIKEIELFDNYNYYKLLDNNNKIYKINLNKGDIKFPLDYLMLTKNGEVIHQTNNIYNNFGKIFEKIMNFINKNSSPINDFLPIKFYTYALNTYDISSNSLFNYNYSNYKRKENEDLIFFYIWNYYNDDNNNNNNNSNKIKDNIDVNKNNENDDNNAKNNKFNKNNKNNENDDNNSKNNKSNKNNKNNNKNINNIKNNKNINNNNKNNNNKTDNNNTNNNNNSNNNSNNNININQNNIINNNNEKELNNIICDYEIKYYTDCIKIMFSILEIFEINFKNIIIRVNSSKIYDIIFNRIFGKKKLKNELKIEILAYLSKFLNKGMKKINNLKEKDFPISSKKFKDLKEYLNINGNLETIKKSYKNNDFSFEVNKIAELFNNNFLNLSELKKSQIKLDFSYIPHNLIFFNGFYCQFCYIDGGNKYPLIEGGNIDNYIYSEEYNNVHGFSFITYIEKFLFVKNKEIKFQNLNMLAYDFLIINSIEENDEKIKEEKYKTIEKIINLIEKEEMTYEIIYKPQIEKDFNLYFKKYRMSCLIILHKKENIEYEVRVKESVNNYTEFNMKTINEIIKNKWKKKNKV